jgi:putative effector of murein hydrolase
MSEMEWALRAGLFASTSDIDIYLSTEWMRNRKHMRDTRAVPFIISFSSVLSCALYVQLPFAAYAATDEFLNLVISSHVVVNRLDASWYQWRLHLDHSRILRPL